MALPARVLAWRAGAEHDVEHVLQVRMLSVGDGADLPDVPAPGDDAFAEEESQGQLAVRPRRPHHHRQRLAVEADLERLLRREPVLFAASGLVADPGNGGAVGGALRHR